MPRTILKTRVDLPNGVREQERVLLVNKYEWAKLQYNYQYPQIEAVEKAATQSKLHAMKRLSYKLKKNWVDKELVQNDEREARNNKYMAERAEKARQMQIIRENERSKRITEVTKLMFYSKDNTKELNKALVLSETLRERSSQIEFEKKLKILEDEKEAEYATRVKKNAADFQNEEQTERDAYKVKMKMFQSEILEQIQEQKEKAKLEKKIEMEFIKEYMRKSRREFEDCLRFESETRKMYKADMLKNVLNDLERVRNFKEAKRLEDEVENKLMNIYSSTKQKIALMCKQKEEALQAEMLQRKQIVIDMLQAEVKVREDEENAQVRKAIRKRDLEDEKAHIEREAYQQRLVHEKNDEWLRYVHAEERRKEEEKKVKQMIVLQRYKSEENDEHFFKRIQQKNKETMIYMRKALEKQVAEKEACISLQREEDVQAFNVVNARMIAEDKDFFKYADEVIEASKKMGRPTLPIERAVVAYKVRNYLISKKKPNPSLKSSISIGLLPDKKCSLPDDAKDSIYVSTSPKE